MESFHFVPVTQQMLEEVVEKITAMTYRCHMMY